MSNVRRLAPAPAAPRLLVHMTDEDLRAIVRDVVREELGARASEIAADYIDAAAAADILGVHPRTVQKLARNQGLPSYPVSEKILRYRRSEVLAWLERRRRGE